MQLADETGEIVPNNAPATRALIIKQNPIAVQLYSGSQSIYATSNLQASITEWQDRLEEIKLEFAGHPYKSYMWSVTLNGADQSSPNGYTLDHQRQYQTVVDPNGKIQFFVASFVDVDQEANSNNGLDVNADDPDVWKNFVTGFSSSGSLYPQCTWLRSPLGITYYAAYISHDGYVYDSYVYYYSFGLRPACWVKIKDQESRR
jgi:hypothetical protein